MIVYIKTASGKIYASPVFAEFGKSWGIKSVVLDESGENLTLLSWLSIQKHIGHFNYFYIDGSLKDGWIKKFRKSGFKEIISNRKLIKRLKHGERVSTNGLNCLSLFDLPLKVVDKFEVNNEQDIETFMTVCWGLHDATIVSKKYVEDDLIVDFDTTWDKHIIITFHEVSDTKNLNDIGCILDSTFIIKNDSVKWQLIDGFDSAVNPISENFAYIIAKKITWQLIIA